MEQEVANIMSKEFLAGLPEDPAALEGALYTLTCIFEMADQPDANTPGMCVYIGIVGGGIVPLVPKDRADRIGWAAIEAMLRTNQALAAFAEGGE